MIADIIPTQKMPKNLSILSYQVPKNLRRQLKIGQLATIPLRNSTTTGVIARLHKLKRLPYPLKNIIQLINPKPIFTPHQLKLFTNLAQFYYVSSSLFVHYNLPKLIKKDWAQLPLKISTHQHHAATEKFIWWPNIKQRQQFYLQQLQKNKKTNSQLLIIVPRIQDIDLLVQLLKLKNNNYLAVHSQLNRQQFFQAYLQVMQANNRSMLIIGTKTALFLPFTNLSTIIVDESDSPWHKQSDMNPRYHVKAAARLMQKIYGQQNIFCSFAPSPSDYHHFKPSPPRLPQQKIKLVNNNYLLANKNYTFISDTLLQALNNNLQQKKSVFILVNKKGEASSVNCADCGHTFICPHCQLPLIKTNQTQLVCYYCQHSEELPPFCPVCHGPKFKTNGLGIQKIEKNLRQLLPPSTHIFRFDKDQPTNQPTNHSPQTAIYLGTQYAFDKIDWSTINLIAMVNTDQLYQHVEFTATSSAYQTLIKLLTLANKNATIILQTFNPQHYLLQSILQRQPQIFYQHELALRKKFNYPPYCYLIKLSYLHPSLKRTQSTAQQLYQRLKHLMPNLCLTAPLPILRQKVRGKYKFNLILKLKRLENFKSLNSAVPADWLIDIQPQNLLD